MKSPLVLSAAKPTEKRDPANGLSTSPTIGIEANAKIDLRFMGRKFGLRFTPYEIKTIFFPYDEEKSIYETDILEMGNKRS